MAVMLFGSALQKLDASQPFYDQLLHNLLLSYKLMIEQKLDAGNENAANALLEECLKLQIKGSMANDAAFRQSFASVYDRPPPRPRTGRWRPRPPARASAGKIPIAAIPGR